MTPCERTRLIDALTAFPDQLSDQVAYLTPAQLTTPYIPGEWTVAQNVHHVVDSHANSIMRTKLILTEERPVFRLYDQDAWACLPDGTGADLANSLVLLKCMHTRWALLLRNLPEESWQREGIHPANGPITLEAHIKSYVQHGLDHMAQIQRTLAAAQ